MGPMGKMDNLAKRASEEKEEWELVLDGPQGLPGLNGQMGSQATMENLDLKVRRVRRD